MRFCRLWMGFAAGMLALAACDRPPVEVEVAAADAVPELDTASRLIAVLESDGDGRLSREEFLGIAHPCRRFDLYDGDGDGFLDPAEVRQSLWDVSPVVPSCLDRGTSVGTDLQHECLTRFCRGSPRPVIVPPPIR